MTKNTTIPAALKAFMKNHPRFILPQVGMDFSIGVGSDCYAWRITEVDPNCKGFTATAYMPKNMATWPDQDWSFEDEKGNPRLSNHTIHCKFGYNRWTKDQDSFYLGDVKEHIHPAFGTRHYYQDPSF